VVRVPRALQDVDPREALELGARWIILDAIKRLYALPLHVLLAVANRVLRQGAEAAWQKVAEGNAQPRKEVPELACPLHAQEPSAHDEHPGLLLPQLLQRRVLFEDAAPAALQKALVDR